MISRVAGSPIVHRLLAFSLAIVGGHTVGQALRVTSARPLLDFGPLYVGSWMIREGREWASLYDPVFFSDVVSHVASAGRILDLGATPPALVLLAYPFTWFTPEYGKFLFAASGVLVLLFGLFGLGAGRSLGWNRSEWIAIAGLVLGSTAASESVLRGGASSWVFGLVALSVSAHALGRSWAAAILSAIAANLSFVGWAPLFFSLRRGSRASKILAGGLAVGGVLLQLAALGPRGTALFGAALKEAWFDPRAFDASWFGRFARLGSSWDGPIAGWGPLVGALLAAGVGLWLFRLHRGREARSGSERLRGMARGRGLLRTGEEWTGGGEGPEPRLLDDPPRVLGMAPALLTGLLLLATPQPMRGYGLLWGVPVWASVVGLELRPSTGGGLVLFLLAVLLLLPTPIGVRLGPDASANLIALASLGLVLWWVRSGSATDR